MTHTHKFTVSVQEFGATIFYTETVVLHYAVRTFFEMCDANGVQMIHPEDIYDVVNKGTDVVVNSPDDYSVMASIAIRKVAI